MSGPRTSSSTPRYVFYLCDNAVDAPPAQVPAKRDLDEVEASIKRGRAEAKRRKELAAQDRSDASLSQPPSAPFCSAV